MKYNYRTGTQKNLWEKSKCLIWAAVALFVIVLLWDMLFNSCQLFITLLIWTWE